MIKGMHYPKFPYYTEKGYIDYKDIAVPIMTEEEAEIFEKMVEEYKLEHDYDRQKKIKVMEQQKINHMSQIINNKIRRNIDVYWITEYYKDIMEKAVAADSLNKYNFIKQHDELTQKREHILGCDSYVILEPGFDNAEYDTIKSLYSKVLNVPFTIIDLNGLTEDAKQYYKEREGCFNEEGHWIKDED